MSSSKEIPPNPAGDLVPFNEYARARPQFFPRRATPNYFLRFHRNELAAKGALVRTASGDLVSPEAVDEYILMLSRQGLTYRQRLDGRRVEGSELLERPTVPSSDVAPSDFDDLLDGVCSPRGGDSNEQ